MKHKKYLGIIAAAMLAVSPVVASGAIGVNQSTTVQAATTLTSDQLMTAYYKDAEKYLTEASLTRSYPILKLTKAKPYITAYVGESIDTLANKRYTDVTSNYGRVVAFKAINIYPTMDNGFPDFENGLLNGERIKKNTNYVAELNFEISPGKPVINPLFTSDYENPGIRRAAFDYLGSRASVLVPVKIVAKPSSTTKVNKHGYVKVRKNHKVRTYTSTGKFTKKYIYGHKTYKLNRKKYIKGHGTCYKIYGKNQWIPSKYLKLK